VRCGTGGGRRSALGRSDLRRSHHLRGAHVHRRPFAQFKAFEDASSHSVMTQGHGWKDKIAAGFTNSGSRSGDKLATLIQLALFAARHGMHWINLGLPPANHSSTGSEPEMNGRGFWLGAGAQSDTDQGPDVAPPEADLAAARHLGRRVSPSDAAVRPGRAVLEAGVRDTVAVPGPATPSDCPLAGGLSN